MTAAALMLVACCALSLVLGAPLIRVLQARRLEQQAYEDAPRSHQVKSGTPTMGGLLFIAAGLLLFVFLHDPLARKLLLFTLGCALLGLLDDYLAIVRGKNMGLRARTKFLATALLGIVFLRALSEGFELYPRDVVVGLPSASVVVAHWAWLLLSLAVIVATTHAVNLTDGLDGLVASAILPPFFVLAVIAVQYHLTPVAVVLAGMTGACIGFLLYNRHPARLFMGDTGSLALGGLLAGSAILTGEHLLLLLIGGVFAAETLSVILQVASFKTTKRRIFRMSPLHHHFELVGWPETMVTRRFWLSSAFLSALGLAIVR